MQTPKQSNNKDLYDKYREDGTTPNPHLAYYLEAADYLGVKWQMISKTGTRFEHNGKKWFILAAETPLNSVTAKYIASRKHRAGKILQMDGIPFPEFTVVENADEAISFFKRFKKIVVKPTNADGGKGVTILPETEKQVRQAFNYAYEKSKTSGKKKVQCERFIRGENYRILTLKDRVIAVVHRKPAFVIGDGKSTILELINIKNKQRVKDGLFKLKADEATKLRLKLENMDLQTVPDDGQEVSIRLNANLSSGGISRECMSEIHPYYVELAIKAMKSLGLEFAGVDLITEDITDPKAGHVINEVNYHSGLRLHYKADEGKIVPVARELMKEMMK